MTVTGTPADASAPGSDAARAPVATSAAADASQRHGGRPAGNWRLLLLLLGLQAVIAAVIYREFLSGSRYFAFADIGSDTYFQFVPLAMHLASYLRTEGVPGWSFQVGLGASLAMLTDPFLLLSAAFGPEAVPGLRIWIFILKIACGGVFFLNALLVLGNRGGAALAGALAYSFCGYVLIDGQWDPHATEFVFYSLILWAVVRHRRDGGLLFLSAAVALTAAAGVFMFSVGVFLAYLFVANLVGESDRREVARAWLLRIFPLALLGLLLAAPLVIPNAMQLLDSPRVSGAQAMFAERLRDLFAGNDRATILAQLAGLLHKDILGSGNDYRGWMNYLEGPGFYVGVIPLLLLAQLWRGSRQDRIWLMAGLAVLAFYIASPVLRYAAFGFGLFYFRVTTLWIAMLLLVLFARALSICLERGPDRRLLAIGAFVFLALVATVASQFEPVLKMSVVGRLLAIAAVALVILLLWSWRRLPPLAVLPGLLALIAVDAMLSGATGVGEGREAVSPRNFGYADETLAALDILRRQDPGFYRVEKTYESVSLCDSLAQGYYGVKSYWFHGSGIVAFNIGMGLRPPRHAISNYTNWLPGLGSRFALHSLLGVKYVISPIPLRWPGFQPIAGSPRVTVYRNETVLPLGIVQESQYPLERFRQLPIPLKDLMIINAAIVERPIEGMPGFDERALAVDAEDAWERTLLAPARRHQTTGLAIEHFSQQRITGRVDGGRGGVLLFSIPDVPGWRLRIDGVETPTFRANLGMLAARIGGGAHRVELTYRPPGREAGMGVALAAAALLAFTCWQAGRRAVHRAAPSG